MDMCCFTLTHCIIVALVLLQQQCTHGQAQVLSSRLYSYLPTANFNGQARDPSAWSVLTGGSGTAFPLCATTQQQSPVRLFETGASNATEPLAVFGAIVDAFVAMPTTAAWTFDGAELRLTGLSVVVLVDPAEPGVSKALAYVAFVVGSAHAIGGTLQDLEVQFVFEPTGAAAGGVKTIVSVLAKAGAVSHHALLGQLLSGLPMWGSATIPAATLSTAVALGSGADLRDFLPASTAFYTYSGSETAPPCARVRWYVFEEPIGVSRAQIALLRRVLGATLVVPLAASAVFQGNNRPLQDLRTGTSIFRFADTRLHSPFVDPLPTDGGRSDVVAVAVAALILASVVAIVAVGVIASNVLALRLLPVPSTASTMIQTRTEADRAAARRRRAKREKARRRQQTRRGPPAKYIKDNDDAGGDD